MRVSDYIIDKIAQEGVEKIFMVSGGGGMFLIESLGNHPKIEHICNHHEQASVMAAEGYQRATKNLGVALVTTGPAATNTLTGLGCAWNDSIPMLVLSGQAKTTTLIGDTGLRQRGTHEVDIVSIVKPITKYAVTVWDKNTIKYHLEKALYLARNGRPGPVLLDIPLDVQQADIDADSLDGFVPEDEELQDLKLDKIVSILKEAKRPIIIAGYGIKLSKQEENFIKLIEKFNIPVVTPKNGFDTIWDNHPLLAGRMGINGQRAGNLAVQNADLILILGARLPLVTVGYQTELFGTNAKKILVDVDNAQLEHSHISVDLKIKADLKDFIPELDKALTENKFNYDSNFWVKKCQEFRVKYPTITEELKNEKKYVNSYYFFDVLSDNMSEKDVLVTDQGATFYSFTTAFRVKKGQLAYTNGGFSPMGFGLPAAIGSCYGKDIDNVVSVNGDGGLQMNLQEIQTMKHYNLPIKLFVFNNNGYLSIKHTQNAFFSGHFVGSDPKSGVSCPDTIKLAKAYGIPSIQIKNHKDLKKGIQKTMKIKGPVIVEVILDPLQPFLPKVSSKRLEDGTMVSMPLEDMAPFLSRTELKEVMINPIAEASLKVED